MKRNGACGHVSWLRDNVGMAATGEGETDSVQAYEPGYWVILNSWHSYVMP